ncbi:MAG: ferredoxin [Methanobacteriales archaeon Met13]
MEIIFDCCGYCGACVAVCPHNYLRLLESGLETNPHCENCGQCIKVCPLGALNGNEA